MVFQGDPVQDPTDNHQDPEEPAVADGDHPLKETDLVSPGIHLSQEIQYQEKEDQQSEKKSRNHILEFWLWVLREPSIESHLFSGSDIRFRDDGQRFDQDEFSFFVIEIPF